MGDERRAFAVRHLADLNIPVCEDHCPHSLRGEAQGYAEPLSLIADRAAVEVVDNAIRNGRVMRLSLSAASSPDVAYCCRCANVLAVPPGLAFEELSHGVYVPRLVPWRRRPMNERTAK